MSKTVSRGLVWGEIAVTYLLYQTLVIALLAFPPALLENIGFRPGLRGGTSISLGFSLLAELIAFGFLLFWMKRQGLTLAQLGWREPAPAISLAIAVVFGLCYSAFTLWSLDLHGHLKEPSLFRLWGVVVGIFGAMVEEIIFRGFVLTRLEQIKVNPRWQVVISGVLFSLIHMSFSLWGMLATFLMGGALAAVYIYYGRSLTAPIVGHAVINALIEPWLLLSLITFFAGQKG